MVVWGTASSLGAVQVSAGGIDVFLFRVGPWWARWQAYSEALANIRVCRCPIHAPRLRRTFEFWTSTTQIRWSLPPIHRSRYYYITPDGSNGGSLERISCGSLFSSSSTCEGGIAVRLMTMMVPIKDFNVAISILSVSLARVCC